MLDTMKKEISEDIKKAYGSGKVSTLEIKNIVENAVSKAIKSAKEGVVNINDVAKEAVVTTVTELKSTENETKEYIGAAINGTVSGISKNTEEIINDIDMELLKTKYRLQEQKESLAAQLKDALNGAKEAASNFPEETKEEIEDAVTDTKLKSIEILGLMKETIKHSVKAIIDEGEEVEVEVTRITQKATENALSIGRLSAQKAKEVSETVILAAVETAQEAGTEVKETTQGAIEGVQEGVVNTIEKAKTKLAEAKDEAKDFAEEDMWQTIEDIETMNDAFKEALNNAAHKVGDVAEDVLLESVDRMQQGASQIKERAEATAEVAFDYLTEKGSQVAYSAKDKALGMVDTAYGEIDALSDKMVKIAKGAFSGIFDDEKSHKRR